VKLGNFVNFALAGDAEERSLRRARLARMVDLLNSPQSSQVEISDDNLALTAARAQVRNWLADPERAEFSSERLIQSTNGPRLATGAVAALDANGVHQARNWYIAEFGDGDSSPYVEVISFDPTDVANLPLLSDVEDDELLQQVESPPLPRSNLVLNFLFVIALLAVAYVSFLLITGRNLK
jgi:hypothetical protein